MIESAEGFELLDAVAEGDPRALGELYSRYADLVYRLAYWITESAADAADVTQDVFIGIPEAVSALKTTTWKGFEAWLKTVTVRAALQGIRKTKRRRELPLEYVASRSLGFGSQHVVDRIALDRALAELPPSQRVVFTLKEIEGFSHAEIGEILGITLGASEARLHRARRHMCRILGSRRER